jgi:hypothetical protein
MLIFSKKNCFTNDFTANRLPHLTPSQHFHGHTHPYRERGTKQKHRKTSNRTGAPAACQPDLHFGSILRPLHLDFLTVFSARPFCLYFSFLKF